MQSGTVVEDIVEDEIGNPPDRDECEDEGDISNAKELWNGGLLCLVFCKFGSCLCAGISMDDGLLQEECDQQTRGDDEVKIFCANQIHQWGGEGTHDHIGQP